MSLPITCIFSVPLCLSRQFPAVSVIFVVIVIYSLYLLFPNGAEIITFELCVITSDIICPGGVRAHALIYLTIILINIIILPVQLID